MDLFKVSAYLSSGVPLPDASKECLKLQVHNGEPPKLEVRFEHGRFSFHYKNVHIGVVEWSANSPWFRTPGTFVDMNEVMKRLSELIGDGKGKIFV